MFCFVSMFFRQRYTLHLKTIHLKTCHLKTDVCSAALSLHLVILITSASLHLVLLRPVKPQTIRSDKRSLRVNDLLREHYMPCYMSLS